MLDLRSWPVGMRVIVRAERPHPGAQLRFTDVDGNRLTAFVTNTSNGQLAELELRHRRRARCEDRIRGAKDTGLTNLPLKDFRCNQTRRDRRAMVPATENSRKRSRLGSHRRASVPVSANICIQAVSSVASCTTAT